MTNPVAIIVGHRESSQGAVATNGTTEWQWMRRIAPLAVDKLRSLHVPAAVLYRPDHPDGLIDLVSTINAQRYSLAIEMHFNSAASPDATGTEVLCYPGSEIGCELADEIQHRLVVSLSLPDRGIKETKVNGAGRRLPMLCGTRCPSVIVEPFFGSNRRDVARVLGKDRLIADAVAQGVATVWKAM